MERCEDDTKDDVTFQQYNGNDVIPSRSQEEVYRKKREEEENDFIARLLKPYSSFLVCHPCVVVTITAFIVTCSIVLSVVEEVGAKPLPDFSNPIKGLEPRGTMISSRGMSLFNLNKYFSTMNGDNKTLTREEFALSNIFKMKFSGNEMYLENYVEGFMLFFEHERRENLFDHLHSICEYYTNQIETLYQYNVYVSRVHHIPNYVAWLNNRTNCSTITTNDIRNFTTTLEHCVGFYTNNSLYECKMNELNCHNIPTTCLKNNYLANPRDLVSLLYNTFYFLADSSLVNDPSFLKVTASSAIIKSLDSIKENLFRPLYNKELEDLTQNKLNGIKVVAYNLWGYKFHIFSSFLYTQSSLAVSAIIFVILLTWYYSRSLFIGLMTLTCIVMAMIIAYFVYVRIFSIHFFPFLNINTIIFIIGIGADDVFVYTRVWEEAKCIYRIEHANDHVTYMIKWTTHALRHATVAMLVTSLTTAAAFYANMSLSVTAAKCFGLYAGTAIIVNYLLMVVYFPSAVVLHDRYFSKCMHVCCPSVCIKRPVIMDPADTHSKEKTISKYKSFEEIINNLSDVICNRYLPTIICRFKYTFIVVLFVLGVCGIVITFITPGLRPPDSPDFQMFSSSSSLEQYNLFYKKRFGYEKAGGQGAPQNITFVFGVQAVDNGNPFNPDDSGTIVFNEHPFDLAKAQVWMRQFCKNLIQAPFYESSKVCSEIVEGFEKLEEPCSFMMWGDLRKCCGQTIPLPENNFRYCVELGLALKKNNDKNDRPHILGKNETMKAFVIPVTTKYLFSIDFVRNKEIVETLEDWTNSQMKNASDALKGWWYGDFRFYDLQDSLFKGTKMSLAIAITCSFVVILLTSMNLLLSIYSILTITFVISVTVGILILDGWRLNIVESAVFSVAAGLSADFTLHYSVAYRMSYFKDMREGRVRYAISHVGSPIFMGAITTFVGGLVMTPSTVRCYVQFGLFLMIVMFISWMYSSFFFLPLCAAIGPTGYFTELRWRKKKKKKTMFDLEMEANNLLSHQIKDNEMLFSKEEVKRDI